jgi:hypothetical protein
LYLALRFREATRTAAPWFLFISGTGFQIT